MQQMNSTKADESSSYHLLTTILIVARIDVNFHESSSASNLQAFICTTINYPENVTKDVS
jgi:hypothetical protein